VPQAAQDAARVDLQQLGQPAVAVPRRLDRRLVDAPGLAVEAVRHQRARLVEAHEALRGLLRVVEGMRVKERPHELAAHVLEPELEVGVLPHGVVPALEGERPDRLALGRGDFIRVDDPWRVAGAGGGYRGVVGPRRGATQRHARGSGEHGHREARLAEPALRWQGGSWSCARVPCPRESEPEAMQLFQVRDGERPSRLGVRRGDEAIVLERPHAGIATVLDLFVAQSESGTDAARWLADAERASCFASASWAELAPRLHLPVDPPEAWGAGVTYRRSADFREEGTGFYDRVYAAERPELFFKASAWRCVGPGGAIGRRRDSDFTAAEPEIALVLDRTGAILGFTLANDVSAWDIERDNPLYLPQSKVYSGCFAFGPVIVTPDEIADPYALVLRCRVTRGEREVFAGEASTAQLKRRFEEIVAWLLRSNEIRTGTVLSTGTGIIQPLGSGLEAGDVVTLSCPEIGELANPVALV
jgi:2-dehydro-3-deoxy-D-arabinonate dehydratase